METFWEKLRSWEEGATKREKFLIVFILVLVPLFLFYQFYYTETKEKINILKEEINKLDLEIKKYKKITEKMKVLEVQMKQREEFLNRIKEILPSEKEIPDVLKRVSDLAKENNLEVITFEPGKEDPRDYYNIVPFKMEIKGRFNNIINFLNSIESLERLIVLNDIKLQAKANQLVATATFYTYKYTGVPLKKEEKEETKGKKK